ncbi:MAG TPA: hypothetical protein VII73_01085 [Caulobacteraceae bacterium]
MRVGLMAASAAAVLSVLALGGVATARTGHGWGSHAGGVMRAHPVARSGQWGGHTGAMNMVRARQSWSAQGGRRGGWQPYAQQGRHGGDDRDGFADEHMRRFAGGDRDRDRDRDDRFDQHRRFGDNGGFGFGVGLGVDGGLYAGGGYDEGSYGAYPPYEGGDEDYAAAGSGDEGVGYGAEGYVDDEGQGGGYYDAGGYQGGADADARDYRDRGHGAWDDDRGSRGGYDVRACSCGTWRWIPDSGR